MTKSGVDTDAAGMGGGPSVAYFSMEVAVHDGIPSFSGGLGVLAGDFLMSCADLGLPTVAVTLCYANGYFTQRLDRQGNQRELPVAWAPADELERLDSLVHVDIAGTSVAIGAWRYTLQGEGGSELPIIFLDTDVAGNDRPTRSITDALYGGDDRHRLEQEIVLGIGGVAMLRALGYDSPSSYHMNEGHSALLTLALLEEQSVSGASFNADLESVREHCVFTTHTPVAAGHDRFPADLVGELLGDERNAMLDELGLLESGVLNMTELGLACSAYSNAVSLRHGEVSRQMFPGTHIGSVTNGVHVGRWAAPAVAGLFDSHLPGWRSDNALLHYATSIDLDELQAVHSVAKRALLDEVRARGTASLDPDAFTIGIARRATPYKQTALLFSDLDRLRQIAATSGPIQVVCSGKAHPRDEPGKELISRIVKAGRELDGAVEVCFLEDYDLSLAALLVAGTDLWLNNPIKPYEASGTSGMKAALNGVPSLSVLDGWWIEGCIEGVTGWAIGGDEPGDDADSLYEKLGRVVAPMYRFERRAFLEVMRSSITLNGSFFNTERMVRQYSIEAYRLEASIEK